MKAYFGCSISGGRDNEHFYVPLVDRIKLHAEVLTEAFTNPKILELDSLLDDRHIFERDDKWLHEANVVVAEASTPSLGVGYELRMAEDLNKDILVLFRNHHRKLSAMISGNPYERLTIGRYDNLDQAFSHIDDFFKSLKTPSLPLSV